MTLIEKLKELYPDDFFEDGTPVECPSNYKEFRFSIPENEFSKDFCCTGNCTECWSREYKND